MHVLLFNIYFHPDPTGTGLVMGELALDLRARGHDVTVVTTVPHYGLDTVPEKYRGRLVVDEHWQGIRIIRTGVWLPHRPNVFSRILSYLAYTILSLPAAFKAAKPDVVICVWPPVSTGLAALVVSRIRRSPLVVNVQDVYPDTLFRNRLVPRFVRAMERVVLRRAARVTVLSEGMKTEVLARGAPKKRVEVVPMWTDTEGIRPATTHNAFRDANDLNGKFVVLYAGNIGTYGGLGIALEAASILKDEPAIRFVIVGRGRAKATLQQRAESLRLTNIVFLDTRPREELSEMLAASDVSLVTLDPRIATTSVPSKAFMIMASGRPILAAMSPENEIAKIISRVGCGWCVPADNPEELAKVIRSVCKLPNELPQMGTCGSEYVEKHHVREKLTLRHAEIIEAAGVGIVKPD